MSIFQNKWLLFCLLFCITHSLYGQYCEPTSTNGSTSGFQISGVELGDLVNLNSSTTTSPAYIDSTSMTATIAKNEQQTIYITVGDFVTSMYYHVWIDYNQDGTFNGTTEYIGYVTSPAKWLRQELTFDIHPDAAIGTTRLRVMSAYNEPTLDPCATFAYGETEDYTVIIESHASEHTWFIKTINTLEPSFGSSVNFVDIDIDGDLDLCLSGRPRYLQNTSQGVLYLNNGSGSFAIHDNITSLMEGATTWSDFNNDGQTDFLYSGLSSSYIAGIDTFDINNSLKRGSFNNSFNAVTKASVAWGDFDNDGDYDVLIAGIDEHLNASTTLYQNNNGAFVNTNTNLHGIYNGKVGFIDYDLDCDLDIIITGTDNLANSYTKIWKNQLGEYVPCNYNIINLKNSSFDWGDINNDSYPDLIICGYNGLTEQTSIYRNDNGNGFILADYVLPGYKYGSTSFGDIDNDGDLDVFIHGVSSTVNGQDYIFINDGTDTLKSTGFDQTALRDGTFMFGDINGDNILDFTFNGRPHLGTDPAHTLIIRNDSLTPNVRPSAPVALTAKVTGKNVYFSWNKATDDHTVPAALTYNLYIGTNSKGTDIISPNANISTGVRTISQPGYIQDTCWLLRNLEPGIYYVAVQSIDNALCPSLFSDEISFEIKTQFSETSFTEATLNTTPYSFFDYDHDHDMDIILSGTDKLRLFKNTPPALINSSSYIAIKDEGYNPLRVLSPNDYNNDNAIDFVVAGNQISSNTAADSSLLLYKYTQEDTYSIIDSSILRHVNFEYCIWADFNNDGHQDFITSGLTTNNTTNYPITYLATNKGDGTFNVYANKIKGFYNCGATVNDFDQDLDMDIVLYGLDSLDTPTTSVFLNQGNCVFEEQILNAYNLYRYTQAENIYSGDYNLDSSPDIFIAGRDVYGNHYCKVLLNHSLTFLDANIALQSWTQMSNYWADIDNDNDLDIITLSTFGSNDKIHIYNNQSNAINEVVIETGMQIKLNTPFCATDLDNKGGIDFIISNGIGQYKQFTNNWAEKNIPAAPDGLYTTTDSLDVILHWNKLADSPGFTYNIRVGTKSDTTDIVSPLADLETGYRYIVESGNASQNNGWRLKNLETGKYYWSVQAINLAYEGGTWAAIDSFVVSDVSPAFEFNTVCFGDTTFFTDRSATTDDIIIWCWNFGDGSNDTITDTDYGHTTHKYAQVGKFEVTLCAITQSGDTATQSDSVVVKSAPDASFSIAPVCKNDSTTLLKNSGWDEALVESWLWDLGNGETSTIRGNIKDEYTTNTTASLTIHYSNSCKDSVSREVRIIENPEANISISGNSEFCYGGTAILYSDEISPGFSYKWIRNNDLQPEKSDSLIVPGTLHAGSYNYALIISDNAEGVECISDTGYKAISIYENPSKTELIRSSKSSIFCEGEILKLSVTIDTNYTYEWFNHELSRGKNSNIEVTSSGKYALKISDKTALKCYSISDSISATFNPSPAVPEISHTGNITFCEGESVSLHFDTVSGTNYIWYNINGSTFIDERRIVVDSSDQFYVKATNNFGCYTYSTDTVTTTMNYKPGTPVIRFEGENIRCATDTAILQTIQNYKTMYWFDGANPEGFDKQLKVAKTGNFRLLVQDTNNCWSDTSDALNLHFIPAPANNSINRDGDTIFCEGGNVNLMAEISDELKYQWFNGVEILTNDTLYNLHVTVSGEYSAQLYYEYDSLKCEISTDIINVVSVPYPSTPDIDAKYEYKICPNEAILIQIKNYNNNQIYYWQQAGASNFTIVDSTLYSFQPEQGKYYVRGKVKASECFSKPDSILFKNKSSLPTPELTVFGPNIWYLGCNLLADNYQYRWYRDDLEQKDNPYRNFFMANQDYGTYIVKVNDGVSDCWVESLPEEIPNENYKSAGMLQIPTKVDVYPNPSNGMVQFDIFSSYTGNVNIQLLYTDGRVAKNVYFYKEYTTLTKELNLSALPKGFYYIKVIMDGSETIQSILLN